MRHFLKDIEISPRNVTDIGVTSDFTGNPIELELNVDKLILPREALTILQQHIATQGVFEGVPYRVEMPGVVLDYYVDLTESPVFRSHEIEVKIKRRNGLDNFFDRADGTTFELLNSKGVIFPSFEVPYLIVKDNAVELAISLGISTFIMTKALIEGIRDLVQQLKELFRLISVSADTPGDITVVAVGVVAQLVYVGALLLAVIKLGQQLLELIFPKIRYYNATKVKDLIEVGCNYLGFNFDSTLLNSLSGLTLLPVPLRRKESSFWDFLQNDLNFAFNKGYPTASDTTPTLGSLVREVEKIFNAKTRVINGTVYIERRDFWANITQNTIVPALVLQDVRQDEYTLNVEEVWKRYYIHYAVDFSDLHTVDDFEVTDAEYSTEPVNVINEDLVTIKGLNDVNIAFALGSRKNKLNIIEKIAKAVLSVIDAVANFFGGNSSLAALIENRIGVLQISQQYFGTTKLLYTTGNSGKQPVNYKDLIGAASLWANYHYINQIQINDYLIREAARTKISNIDFVNLLNNNFAEIEGTVVEILKIEYINERSYATITYKEPFDYADGKVTTLVINE